MPRSVVRTLVAAGSVSKKSMSLALASGCFVRDDTDQYMDALLTIFGDSPLACAGIRSSFISVPLAALKAEIWVWNSRWNAALFVANMLWSRTAVVLSTWRPAGGVAFMATSSLA
jgi:hypothetical protein